MSDHFLTKSRIDLDQCLAHGDDLALDAYPALRAALEARAGPEAAALFAEPLVSRGNDSSPPSVSWYIQSEGNGQPMSRLGAASQADAAAYLTRVLPQIAPLMQDDDVGPLAAASLHLSDPDDVWVVNGKPVIINWGMLGPDKSRSPAARAAQYSKTLGRFMPLAAAPPLDASERSVFAAQPDPGPASASAGVGAAAATGVAAASAAGAVTGANGGGNANPSGAVKQDRPRRAVPVGAWIPLVLLLLISAGVLTWLLIPGNRLFQERVASAVSPEEAVQLAEDVNRALEERIVALQAALDGAVCRSDGTLLMPDGVTIEGLLPPDDLDPADGPGSVREARTPSILPPAAERVRVGSEGGFPDTATLLAHIEERTALVLVQGQRGLGNGTGFFVGSDLLVTNYHVIDGADADGIYVSNEAIGSLRPAELVKALGPMDATGGDFALLRVPGVSQPSFEVLATDSTLRLQSVIAAGYPGDLLVSDEAFQQLRAGDLSAVPGLAVTDGTITAEQRFNSATEVLVHSAPISKGNSGGPLIDYCGRMIGVNTFVVKGPMRTLNFALSGRDLARFLEGTPATPRVVSAACNPQIERPSPPIAEASVADDVPLQPLNLGGQDQ